MQETRYVARTEFLVRTGMCVARKEMRAAPGKSRLVECAVCGVMLDLGPIDLGYKVFYRHLMMRRVPRNVMLVETESEDTENETDSDDLMQPEDDGEEIDEEKEGKDTFEDEEEYFSDEEE